MVLSSAKGRAFRELTRLVNIEARQPAADLQRKPADRRPGPRVHL